MQIGSDSKYSSLLMQIGSDSKYSSLLMQIGSDSKTSRLKEKLKDKEQKLFWVLLFNNN